MPAAAKFVDKQDGLNLHWISPWGCSSAGEHLLCKQGARGSIPLTSTKNLQDFGVTTFRIPSR